MTDETRRDGGECGRVGEEVVGSRGRGRERDSPSLPPLLSGEIFLMGKFPPPSLSPAALRERGRRGEGRRSAGNKVFFL